MIVTILEPKYVYSYDGLHVLSIYGHHKELEN